MQALASSASATVALLARPVALDDLLARLRRPAGALQRLQPPLPDELAALRIRPLFVLLTAAVTVILAGLALTPKLTLPVNDKVLHALGNAVFTLSFYPVMLPLPSPPWAAHLPLLATTIAGGLVVGVGSEFAQAWLSSRRFDWHDVAANLVGFAAALALSHFVVRPSLDDVEGDESRLPGRRLDEEQRLRVDLP